MNAEFKKLFKFLEKQIQLREQFAPQGWREEVTAFKMVVFEMGEILNEDLALREKILEHDSSNLQPQHQTRDP